MEILLNLKEPLLSEGGGDPRSVEEKSSNDEEVMCTINNSQQAIIDIESVDDPDVAFGHDIPDIGGDVLELGRAGSSRLPYCVSEWLNQHQKQISNIKLWAYFPSVLVFRIVSTSQLILPSLTSIGRTATCGILVSLSFLLSPRHC